jgi:hypothetical protein
VQQDISNGHILQCTALLTSKPGTVLAVGEDIGYGNYILVGFEA